MISDQRESSNAVEPMKGIWLASTILHCLCIQALTVSYKFIEGS